jgi:uncharacterized protein YndB with AHSA1/START domain
MYPIIQTMESAGKHTVTIEAIIGLHVSKAWKFWTTPADIVRWNNASEDWHTTKAENDLKQGGSFSFRMEARDRTMGFDFGGIYDKIVTHKQIDYTLGDGRKVKIVFSSEGNKTKIVETFETEDTNTVEQQRSGWRSILDNFKKYAESTIR